jgi:phytoene dehydrogenase-like protein
VNRVLVLGGGLDGLAAAVMLARAGLEVDLVERLPSLGGLAGEFPLDGGGVVPGIVPCGWGMPSDVARELGPQVENLEWVDSPSFLPPEIQADVRKLGAPLRRLFARPPAGVGTGLLGAVLGVRLQGAGSVHQLARILGMAAADWLAELPVNPAARVAAAASTSGLSPHGPSAPGTAGMLFLKEACSFPIPAAGPAALAKALEREAVEAGARFLTGVGVASFVVEDGAVVGAVLDDGERLQADQVLSTLDPASTFLCLMPAGTVPPAVEREARTFRSRGTVGLALFQAEGPAEKGAKMEFCSASHLDALERAADAASAGRVPDSPVLMGRLWGGKDEASLTGVAEILHLPAPGTFTWNEEARGSLRATVKVELEMHLPAGVKAGPPTLLTPEDIGIRFGITGGHLFHGEVVPDQWHLMRPGRLLSGYQSPIQGILSAGRGHHPAGTLAVSGLLAARALVD